jgi:GNAT superfamily N-acetyltransferase
VEGEVTLVVRRLTVEDAEACDAIMRTLPDFFAYEPGLADCARAVRTQAGWVAEDDGEVIGFATWERRTDETAEVTWMAVRADRRHGGVGTEIIEAVVAEMKAQGFVLALAMTSARPKDAEIEDTYGPTRAFWTARGFLPLIELDIWETDVALLQVRALA